jgi:hypothetical protein
MLQVTCLTDCAKPHTKDVYVLHCTHTEANQTMHTCRQLQFTCRSIQHTIQPLQPSHRPPPPHTHTHMNTFSRACRHTSKRPHVCV